MALCASQGLILQSLSHREAFVCCSFHCEERKLFFQRARPRLKDIELHSVVRCFGLRTISKSRRRNNPARRNGGHVKNNVAERLSRHSQVRRRNKPGWEGLIKIAQSGGTPLAVYIRAAHTVCNYRTRDVHQTVSHIPQSPRSLYQLRFGRFHGTGTTVCAPKRHTCIG